MKLFRYDKKVWDDGDTDYTWQLGIFKNRSLLWIHYENPSRIVYLKGGFNILLSFFSCSLVGVDFQIGRSSLGFYIFAEYD